jgi:hypothetical protein
MMYVLFHFCRARTNVSQHCYMCLNGVNKSAINCHNCPRTLCSNCITIPPYSSSNLVFFCLNCHQQFFTSQPYKVRVLCSNSPADLNNAQGLYFQSTTIPPTVDGNINLAAFRPVHDQGVKIKGHFQMTARCQVINTKLLIVHFYLSGLRLNGSPAKILSEYMSAFLDQGVLVNREISFDLSSDMLISEHANQIQKNVTEIMDQW